MLEKQSNLDLDSFRFSFSDSGGNYPVRESSGSAQARSVFIGLFERLEIVILQGQADGTFVLIGQAPTWFHSFYPDNRPGQLNLVELFPFLSGFLSEAQSHWQSQKEGILESGLWVEFNPEREEVPLAASALIVDSLPLLLIRQSQAAYHQKVAVLQKGREAALEMIQERKENAVQLQQSTFYDLSTGLPNQLFLRVHLVQALERLKQGKCSPFVLSLLSVEPLKVLRRRYGQAGVEQLLEQVIDRIRQILAPKDLLARFSEDSFVLLHWGLNAQNVEPLIESMLQSLALPYQLGPHEVAARFSLGLSLETGFHEQPEEVLDHASIAMGYAKHHGRPYAVFNSAMHLQVIRQAGLERDLPQAIRQQQLLAYYEPVVSLKEKAVTGFEALVRWHHPTYGLLAPGSFIPLAEENGFVVPLGEWMLEQACTQVAQWNQDFNRSLAVQVNLSARQLSEANLLETVQTIVQHTPVLPKYLKLEITESMVHQNLDATVEQLERIKAFGVHICMDDFGTGYSSLNYLHQLPIDILKIDRSLTQAMNPGSTAILRATINLAHDLGLDVIAEGVEIQAHLDRLLFLGCDYAQGYLFSKPMPPHMAQEFFQQPLALLQDSEAD